MYICVLIFEKIYINKTEKEDAKEGHCFVYLKTTCGEAQTVEPMRKSHGYRAVLPSLLV
jgi:hypothetical protein